MPEASIEELRKIAHRAMALAASPFLCFQKRGRHLERDGVAYTTQDYAGPGFNFAAVLGPAPPLDRVLEAGRNFFTGCRGGFGILVDPEAGHPIEAEIKARGWPIAEDEAALVLPDLSAIPLPHPKLNIQRATTESHGHDFSSILDAAFDLPPGLAEEYTLIPASSQAPDLVYLLGYLDRVPVATSIFYGPGGHAGVAGVATHPDFQRRGFGMAMTWAALREGAARGYSPGVLRAMGESLAMYKKMGFIHVCNHRTYAVPVT
jgi:ribosomal protein S18 acetylase RimI-like enzyme